MCLWQMLSYGIYGIVAGTKKYFELNSVKKEQGKFECWINWTNSWIREHGRKIEITVIVFSYNKYLKHRG